MLLFALISISTRFEDSLKKNIFNNREKEVDPIELSDSTWDDINNGEGKK